MMPRSLCRRACRLSRRRLSRGLPQSVESLQIPPPIQSQKRARRTSGSLPTLRQPLKGTPSKRASAPVYLAEGVSSGASSATATSSNELNAHLSADLDHAVSGQMEIAARIIGVASKQDEHPILPWRHPRPRISADGPPRQEEGRRHDVEAPSLLAGYAQCARNVGCLHEAKADANA